MGGRTVERGQHLVSNTSTDLVKPVNWDVDTPMIKQSMLDFYAETGMVGPCDPEWFVSSTKELCDKGVGMLTTIHVSGKCQGAVAGIVGPSMFHPYLSLTELFFYIKPESRRLSRFRLLHHALIDWGREMGAIECFLGNFEKELGGSLSCIYKRLGYVPFNQMFYGRIE